MAGTKRLMERATYLAIVKALKEGQARDAIAAAHDVPRFVVGKVAAAAGIAKAKPEVRTADAAIVKGWLGVDTLPKVAARKPAAKSRRRSA